MDIAKKVRKGVARISKATVSVQADVTWKAWIGTTGKGVDSFADPVPLKAIVEPSSKQHFTADGKVITLIAKLTFLDPIANTTPNAGQVRRQPLDPRDIFILDDGRTAPTVDVNNELEDPGLSRPFLNQVSLGTIARR